MGILFLAKELQYQSINMGESVFIANVNDTKNGMQKRSTVEIDSILLKAIKIIATRRGMKHKFVTDQLLRYSLSRINSVFSINTKPTTQENKQ